MFEIFLFSNDVILDEEYGEVFFAKMIKGEYSIRSACIYCFGTTDTLKDAISKGKKAKAENYDTSAYIWDDKKKAWYSVAENCYVDS